MVGFLYGLLAMGLASPKESVGFDKYNVLPDLCGASDEL
jgi:hypothetical protein